MCGGLILSCCPRNPHGHERALKEEEERRKTFITITFRIFFLSIRLFRVMQHCSTYGRAAPG